jgi:hypothetical protein
MKNCMQMLLQIHCYLKYIEYVISEAFTLKVLKSSRAIINENVELKTNISELSISIIRIDDDPYNTAIDL